jgi:hypothetical protein
MGGIVSDVLGGVGDAVSGVAKTAAPYAGLIGGALGGPLGAIAGSAIGSSVLSPGQSPATQAAMGNVLQGGLNQYGGMLQSRVSKEAVQAAQEEARRSGQQAASMAQFRPVGITTRFGSSQFQVDPTTGQLVSAGYSSSPEIQAAQQRLMGLGAGYLAQSPEQVAADYMAKQQALLAPGRERESALLANQLANTGRTGLSIAQGGGLMAANPEQAALANARAMQDLALAAQANQAGQQQVQFGTGLFGQAGQLEQLAQQPLSLSSQLAQQAAQAGGTAGRLGLAGGLGAAEMGLRPELQYNQTASLLQGLTSPTSMLGQGLGGLFGGGGQSGAGGGYGSYTGSSMYDGSGSAPNTYLYDNPNLLWG